MKRLILFAIFLFSVNSYAQRNDWSVSIPWPQGNNLKAIVPIDANTVIAAGAGGVIIRTTDGGQTWSNTFWSDLMTFNSIHFVDNLNGWMVSEGESYVILKTTDAGETWEELSAPENYLRSIFFVNATTGWIIGDNGNPYKTTDGGYSWQNQGNIGFSFRDIFFADADTGWAVGWQASKLKTEDISVIRKTTDGGLSWFNQSLPMAGASSVYFTSLTDGIVVGVEGNIARTTNGGAEWYSVVSGVTNTLLTVDFSDHAHGWAVGDFGKIVNTNNGGETWTTQNSGTSFRIYSVQGYDSLNVWAVGEGGLILRTTNGGQSWIQVSKTMINGYLYSVSSPDTAIGWIQGYDDSGNMSKIFRTTNSGQDWSLAGTNLSGDISDIFSTDDLHGWVTRYTGGIDFTTDGGVFWHTANIPNSSTLYSVYFINNTTGWACGSGLAFKTTDGGQNWFVLSAGSMVDCYSVFFINENTGWLAADMGTKEGVQIMKKTTDGGMTWIDQNLPEPISFINDVKFLDENTGCAVGDNENIIKTTDGGDYWYKVLGSMPKSAGNTMTANRPFKGRVFDKATGKLTRSEKRYPPQNATLNSVGFAGGNTWFAVGDMGLIYKSTDAGENWEMSVSGTGEDLYDAAFPAPGRGWAVGNSGTLLKYHFDYAPEPAAQPTNLAFSDVTIRGFRAQFDHASPSVDGYIAVRRKGAEPDFMPVDGVQYSAKAGFGENEIAYVGSDNYFIENELMPDNEYFYKIFSYNGSDETINYLTVNPLEGSQVTLFSNAIFVTTEEDYAEGCLRYAIDSANSHIGADTIMFALYGGVVLSFGDRLPAFTDDFTCIDGDMNLDGIPDVSLSGMGLDSATLMVRSSNNTIKGLILNNFQSTNGAALVIEGGHYNTIIGNYIGTDNNGTWQMYNETGIMIFNGTYNNIGDGTGSGRNIISGNITGVWISGEFSLFNEIRGNYIGIDATGLNPLPNEVGIGIGGGASYNHVGSHDIGGRNLFYTYEESELPFFCSVMMGEAGTDSNYVIGNWFGINADQEPVGGLCGVGLYNGAMKNFIGDGTVAGRNIIAGQFFGINVMASDSNYILGNYIGTLPDGITPIMNLIGVFINSSGNTIGDTTEGGRNIISTNEYGALAIIGGDMFGGPNPKYFDQSVFQKFKEKLNYPASKSAGLSKKSNRVTEKFKTAYHKRMNTEAVWDAVNNRIIGNYIGVGADGITPLGNAGNIAIDNGSSGNAVMDNMIERNIIAYSASSGIAVTGDAFVRQNRFYANSLFSNDSGIDIMLPAQDSVWPPNILSYDTLTHILSGNAGANALIQIYADDENQGKIFLDTTYADENGNWSKTVIPMLNMNFTALQDSNGNTSAFSEPFSSGLTDPLIVTRVDDNLSLGTLRNAIDYANTNPGPDAIRFSLPKGSILHFNSALPAIQDDSTSIDGDVDFDGSPDIVLSGSGGLEGNTLTLYSSYNTIKGLVLIEQNFGDGAAITIDGGHYNKIIGCYIGTDITGTASAQNYCGIKINNGASFNQIGDGTSLGRNVISGNREGNGIEIYGTGTNYNIIAGNYLGLNASGYDSLPNSTSVFINDGARGNIIGGHTEGDRNLICSYLSAGKVTDEFASGAVMIMGDQTDSNIVAGNWFGLQQNGVPLSGQSLIGVVVLWDAVNNFIGDGLPGGGNVIANSSYGVLFTRADSNFVYGNMIGTDPAGNNAIPNETGVIIRKSSYNQIGGVGPLFRNVISGNNGHGVEIVTNDISGGRHSMFNRITGNFIGVKADGVSPMGNVTDGLFFKSENGWNVTFNEAVDNVIAHNGNHGISFNESTTANNALFRNLIYNNAAAGIFIDSVAQNNILPPVIDSIVGRTVYGSMANSDALIQLYWDEGNQGQHFIDTVREGSDGYWSFILPDSVINYNITALQTHNYNTSVFSSPVMALFPLIVNRLNPYSGPGTLDYAVTYANNNPGPDSIIFKLPPQTIIYSDMTYVLTSNGTVIDGDMNQDGIPDIGIARSNIYLQSAVSITGNDNTVKNMLIGGYVSQYHEATVYITGQHNQLLGNYLGYGFDGIFGNTWNNGHVVAVKLDASAKYNRIGDGTVSGRNLISNATASNIVISGIGTDSNYVLGNYIGVNKFGRDTIDPNVNMSNVLGIQIYNGAKHNFIGDGTPGGRNIISGNRVESIMNNSGIRITGIGTDYNEINGNYIGTDPTGTEARPNVTGVYVTAGAQYNSIKNNLISGNVAAGVVIESANTSHNMFTGNNIGLNTGGNAALPNEKGVMIIGAVNNTIGDGTIPGRNIISGNAYHGVQTMSDSGNVIVANYIGTDMSGTAPIGNLQNGIFLSDNSRYNLIDRNLISGNGTGIHILQTTPIMPNRNHVITSNFIGTNAAGTASIGNVHGIVMRTETGGEILNVFIGDGNTASRNIISGNDSMGIMIEGNAHDNYIYSNFIGLDQNGTGILGNGGDGVRIQNNANHNHIGNETANGRNVITGNALGGIILENQANYNYIMGNFIGTDQTGTIAIGNALDGIRIFNSTANQIGNGMIGGVNVIAGNNSNNPTGDFAGIILDHAFSTIIDSNHIGTDLSGTMDLGNHGFGIRSVNISQNHAIRSNLIAHNDSGGLILEGNSTVNHFISYNQFIDNGNFNMLFTDGANRNMRIPYINSVGSGNVVTGIGAFNSMIQIYKASGSNGQTLQFVDTTYADGLGSWTKIIPIDPGTRITALTDSGGNTSMFAPLFTPLIGTPGANPMALNFGNRNVGDSVQTVLKIGTNLYASQITSLTQGASSPFRIDSVSPLPVATLLPGDTMLVYVTFKPMAYISYADTIRINYTNGSSPVLVPLTGHGSGIGNLSLSKSNVDFQNVLVNTNRIDTVYLTANNGPVTLDTITLAIDNEFEFMNAISYPYLLAENATLPLVLSFLPTDTGYYYDSLIISNNGGTGTVIVTMSGRGTVIPNGELHADFTDINFGPVLTGGMDLRTVKLTAALNSVTIDSIKVYDGTHYGVMPSQSIPFTIGLTDTLMLDVHFMPQTFGTFSDSMLVYNNSAASPLVILFTGQGIAGTLSASTTNIDFGTQVVGDSVDASVVFKASTGMVQISQITQGIGGAVDFKVASAQTLPQTLHAGIDSMIVTMRFKPVSAGAKVDTLKIYSNSSPGEYLVYLSGTATINQAPNVFALKSPTGLALINDRTPDFSWEGKGDPDGDALTYIIDVSKLSDFSTIAYRDTTADTIQTAETQLDTLGIYYWRVTALDGRGGSTASNTGSFRIDAKPAVLTAGTFFGTVTTQYLSVNVISDKLMTNVQGKIVLRSAANIQIDSVVKTFDLESAANKFYQTPYKLASAGKLFVTVTGTDSAQNITTVAKNYTISTLAKEQTLAMNSDDGHWQITAPKRTVDEDGFLMVNELSHETVTLKDQSVTAMAKASGEWTMIGDGLNIQGTAPIRSGQGFMVTLRYDESTIAELQSRYFDYDERNIGMYADKDGEWVYVGGEGRSGQVQAKMKDYGRVKLMYNPEHEFLPVKVELAQNYPNPFNPSTTIRFGVPQEGKVKLVIYNVLGQKVKELVNDSRTAGYHTMIWNGRSDNGHIVSSGVYLYRLETPQGTAVKKMMFVK